MRGVSESLAGRVGIANLLGLSWRELNGTAASGLPFVPTVLAVTKRLQSAASVSLEILYKTIWRGSFPAVALNKKIDRDLFYSSYIQTYLQRDIRDLANIGNQSAFLKFLRAAAGRTGQLLNMSDMARDASISPATARTWLSILEASNLIYLLEPYHTNVTKRLIKAPKLYFLDTGLACYLTEWSSPQTLEAGAMSGAILETFMLTEILKSYWHNSKRAPLYYYRDKDKKEIDLLIVQDKKIHPVEFKKTAAPDKHAVRNFSALNHLQVPVGNGAVICLAKTIMPITKSVSAIPVHAL
jgi:hypothetical protein